MECLDNVTFVKSQIRVKQEQQRLVFIYLALLVLSQHPDVWFNGLTSDFDVASSLDYSSSRMLVAGVEWCVVW